MQNKIIFTLILVITGIITGGFYLLIQQNTAMYNNFYMGEKLTYTIATSTATTTENNTKEAEQKTEKNIKENKTVEKNFIYIGSKNPGKNIDIDVVFLKQEGFVVVYENTFEPTGELLAVSKYLEAGEHVKIPLQLLRKVQDGEVFTAMLHIDDGDKLFSLSDDVPIRDDSGEGVYAQIVIKNFMPVIPIVEDGKKENQTVF